MWYDFLQIKEKFVLTVLLNTDRIYVNNKLLLQLIFVRVFLLSFISLKNGTLEILIYKIRKNRSNRMLITQKDMIHSLSKLLDWLEQESNWGTNAGELRFITGRIGELYTAIMTNGQMATETNQKGYDVVSESGERISVKATTRKSGSHQFRFNSKTLTKVDRIVLVYVNAEDLEVQIIYDGLINEAKKLMVDTKDGRDKSISQSKVLKNSTIEIRSIIMQETEYKNYKVQKLESGTIRVIHEGNEVPVVKPILREIAKEIGVDINNGNGNLKTTRVLGNDVIRQLIKEDL